MSEGGTAFPDTLHVWVSPKELKGRGFSVADLRAAIDAFEEAMAMASEEAMEKLSGTVCNRKPHGQREVFESSNWLPDVCHMFLAHNGGVFRSRCTPCLGKSDNSPLEKFCPGRPFEPSFSPRRGLLLCSTIR